MSQLEAKLLARPSTAEFVSAQQAAADVRLVLKAACLWGSLTQEQQHVQGNPEFILRVLGNHLC